MADEAQQPQIMIQPDQMAGVWANFATVSHSEHEFTFNFIRLDYSQNPLTGIVVSRVSVSPLFITQLQDAINDQWTRYAEKAMPREVFGGSDQDSDSGTEASDPSD